MVHDLLTVLDLGTKKSLLRPRVVLHRALVIIEDVCGWYVLEVGPKPLKKFADVLGANFGPASLDVRRIFQFDTVAPPFLKAPDPMLPGPVVVPPGLHVVLDAVRLH
jgi:hypothetical protein